MRIVRDRHRRVSDTLACIPFRKRQKRRCERNDIEFAPAARLLTAKSASHRRTVYFSAGRFVRWPRVSSESSRHRNTLRYRPNTTTHTAPKKESIECRESLAAATFPPMPHRAMKRSALAIRAHLTPEAVRCLAPWPPCSAAWADHPLGKRERRQRQTVRRVRPEGLRPTPRRRARRRRT